MADTGVTVQENDISTLTLRESPASSDATLVYGAVSVAAEPSSINNFRGWKILEQLPTKGAEADIFIVDASGERRVLKLYRHKLEPKIEILNRITSISRENSRCFVTYFETGFDESTGRWYELQEFIQNGSVKDLPRDAKRSQSFVAQFIPELSAAIQCLHDNGIIHCDIKPANVLVRNIEPLDLVLADFGISSLMASDMSQKMTGLKGTPMYWAPEAFSRVIGRACDWWGFGMMMLELLAGEHPFEGMSDSQIIRKLTLGNVDVPEILGSDWGLLIKGLLTKDDAKRWGKNEIDRWYAGARDIPVHYENDSSVGRAARPFQIEGLACHSAREIASAISEREEPWGAAGDYLRFIRHWYESNLMFDEASKLAGVVSQCDPVTALFRFVNENARLPFRAMGREINFSGLSEILSRAASGSPSNAERLAAEMLGDGRLAALYAEYANFGAVDAALLDLMDFLARKPLASQLPYARAMSAPEEFILPGDPDAPAAERLKILKSLTHPPFEKKRIEAIEERFVLPGALFEALRSQEYYSAAAERLVKWELRGLLIERGNDAATVASQSLNGYERAAFVKNFEHTAAMMSEINFVSEHLRGLQELRPTPELAETLRLLEILGDSKISSRDKFYVDSLAERLSAMDEYARGRLLNAGLGASIAGITFALFRVGFGFAGIFTDQGWAFASIVSLMIAMLLRGARTGTLLGILREMWDENRQDEHVYDGRLHYFSMSQAMNNERRGGPFTFMIFMLVAFITMLPTILPLMPPEIPRALSLSFPLLGAPLGAAISDIIHHIRMKKKLRAIISLCEEYTGPSE